MSPLFAFIGLWSIILAVALFAWVKGGSAERYGSLLVVVTGVLVVGAHGLLPAAGVPLSLLTLDGLLALAFLLLAMLYGRTWLGAALVLQAIQFSVHAYYFIGDRHHDTTYSLANNLVTLSIQLAIIVGTMGAMRRSAA